MKVEAMFFDYDGTLSPINVGREEAQIPSPLKRMLDNLSKITLIGIVTTKDYGFISTRAHFAQVLACIGGLEILSKKDGEYKTFYSYGKSKSQKLENLCREITPNPFFVEEKRLSTGEVVGLCFDWRKQKGLSNILDNALEDLKKKASERSLYLVQDKNMPFIDVYISKINKGMALKRISELFSLNLTSCVYFGDSQTDNSAFRKVGLSIGILHAENKNLKLECKKLVKFDDLTGFLEEFITSIDA